jgi:hypothetical protein
MNKGTIDTHITIARNDKETTIVLPYMTHLTHDDIYDSKNDVVRVAFGTGDTSLPVRDMFLQMIRLNTMKYDTFDKVIIKSGVKIVDMRDVGMIITRAYNNIYVEFESERWNIHGV